MFKKPLSELKTSAPIRSSDRRKLRQRVLQSFPVLQAEEGDVLVPDGLQLQKFSTHLDEPGVAYLSPEGDPLWFTIGKGSDDLIPTVYTLWKRPDLLPFLSTPAPVVPKLVGGADLMIPGVVQHSPTLSPDQLVSVTQYHRGAIGPPLAVGTMAVSSDILRSAEETDVKGKAVYVLHTWKDALWEMGPSKKTEVPAPRELKASEADVSDDEEDSPADANATPDETAGAPSEELNDQKPAAETQPVNPSPEAGSSTNISFILRAALLQAISTTLSGLPPSSFPMTASTFWSTYVLPARPAYALGTYGLADLSAIDVKQSTFKNVKTFLKNSAKDGLIKIKETKSDVMVTAVFPKHPDVAGHHSHRTVGDMEARAKKAETRENEEREAEEKRKGEFQVAELWQPSGTTVPFFVTAGKDTSGFYSINDIKTIVTDYISSRRLVNANDQQYINVGSDEALAGAVSTKGKDTPEFMKRDEVLKLVRAHMQAWHQITAEGRDIVRKKGEMKPVSVVVKIRQGRKACTLITGFEPFGLEAEEIADELRRICASSTTVTPVHGKPNVLEVMVQGKQIKNVSEFLMARGIPKGWITSSDQTTGKKK
ncbi:eukaryotic translation initiation factor SUI1 family protein [Trametes versicolor FP-101664 SS1]|uniref:eukaryotic translation initiation factor SUI1 family protein n=1 Tax=Trametes versicolor (strain FP-101664) TaxID=717944 RepID=UPI00046237D7|nr:eukaryotic translation initiation factor SUI1 family protein [Trametes versicolor FP-101664 SS1]EIW56725.1 eukaryotic translation initiation factor SUI1 family protein [Trametes versicolor FP-101664 SS1]